MFARWGLLCLGLASCQAASPDEDVPEDTDDSSADTDTTGGDTAPVVDPLSWALEAPGPYQVGLRIEERTYAPRDGESRTITVNIWYPTEATTGEALRYADLAPADDTLGNAPPAASVYDGGFPLWAYSHGDRAFGGSSAFLMRHLASHGWVAVAPDHLGNLLVDPKPDRQEHWYERPQDLIQSVDLLEELPDDDPLAGLVDTSAYVMSGHSRGGTTVWSIAGAAYEGDPAYICPDCSSDQRALFDSGRLADPRAKAFVLLATGVREQLYGAEGVGQAAPSPWLLLTGSEDGDGGTQAWADTEGFDIRWAQLEGGCHQTFALGPCPTLDPSVGFPLVDTYALAFGRAQLLGDEAERTLGLLDATIVPDGVTAETR